jgi:tetratricopeptide (TPR) repeat protein
MRVFTVCLVLILAAATLFAAYRHLRRNSYDALMGAAEELCAQEQYGPAYEAYKNAAVRYPDKFAPLLGAARSAERGERLEDAIEAYRSILDFLAHSPFVPIVPTLSLTSVLYEIGRLHSLLKLWDKAEESFKASVEADSANYAAHFALGSVLEERGRLLEALTAYKNALGVSPSSEAAQDAVKRVSLILSPPPSSQVKTAEDVKRKYDEALRGGIAALERRSYRDASQFFAEALAVRSADADAWVGFAEARAGLGDTSGAITSLERALEREPGHTSAKSRLDELRKEKGKKTPLLKPERGARSLHRKTIFPFYT